MSSDRTRQLRRKNLLEPDAVREFPHGVGALVRVGPVDVGRAFLEPGWRWSTDVKPVVGTEWCESHHLHVVLAGRFGIRMRDGSESEFVADDVVDLPPGHDAWVVGDERAVILDISGNVSDFAVPASATRAVLTVLMSDIVGSTETAARVGEVRWKQLLGHHNRIVRHELDRFRGREVKTTGDGFLATFVSAAAAVECAASVAIQLSGTDTEVRIGIHTGEVEVLDDDVRGLAVHTTARVMGATRGSEVIASVVTRALAERAVVRFEDRGSPVLKGLETPMQLFAVKRASAL